MSSLFWTKILNFPEKSPDIFLKQFSAISVQNLVYMWHYLHALLVRHFEGCVDHVQKLLPFLPIWR